MVMMVLSTVRSVVTEPSCPDLSEEDVTVVTVIV
jgi:hypothetical protein